MQKSMTHDTQNAIFSAVPCMVRQTSLLSFPTCAKQNMKIKNFMWNDEEAYQYFPRWKYMYFRITFLARVIRRNIGRLEYLKISEEKAVCRLPCMLLRRNPVLVPGFADNNNFQYFANINQSYFWGVVRKNFFGEIMSDLFQNFIYGKI